MTIRKLTTSLLAASVLLTGAAQAAVTTFTDQTAFDAAAGATTSNSFETATLADPTTVDFGDGTFSCAGSSFCPGFFGLSGLSRTGAQAVVFASPDSATFTFNQAITSFGVFIGGFGDVAPGTLTATVNGQDFDLFTNFSAPGDTFAAGNELFAGLIDPNGFTSITFSSSNSSDGIFFDDLFFGGSIDAVPLPGAAVFLLTGMGAMGAMRRRKA